MKPLELIEQGRFLSEEFMLWLWRRGVSMGGSHDHKDGQSACFVDDVVKLASESGDVQEVSLRKGNPAESKEAFEALARGMRPVQMKVRLMRADMEWVFTLSPGMLALQGLKSPPSSARGMADMAAERLMIVNEALRMMEDRFAVFLRERVSNPEQFKDDLQSWIRAGLAGLLVDAGEMEEEA